MSWNITEKGEQRQPGEKFLFSPAKNMYAKLLHATEETGLWEKIELTPDVSGIAWPLNKKKVLA